MFVRTKIESAEAYTPWTMTIKFESFADEHVFQSLLDAAKRRYTQGSYIHTMSGLMEDVLVNGSSGGTKIRTSPSDD